MIDFDALVLAPCLATFGEAVSYTPAGGSEDDQVTMTAVFDQRYREASFRDGVEVVETRPILGMRAVDFTDGLPLQGSLFVAGGSAYVVAEPVEADGHGHVKIRLRLAANP